jgi:hypothetical protein
MQAHLLVAVFEVLLRARAGPADFVRALQILMMIGANGAIDVA